MINYTSSEYTKKGKLGLLEILLAGALSLGFLTVVGSCAVNRYRSRSQSNKADTEEVVVENHSALQKSRKQSREKVDISKLENIPHLTKNLTKHYAIDVDDLREPKILYLTTFTGEYSGASNRHLDSKEYYCALRVNYDGELSKEQWFPDKPIIVVLTNPKTGKSIECPLLDYGPGTRVTRKAGNQIVDVSPRVARELFGVGRSGRVDKREVIVQWKDLDLGKSTILATATNPELYSYN